MCVPPASLALVISLIACATLTASAMAGTSVPGLETGITPDDVTLPMPDDVSQFKQPESLVQDLQRIQTGPL